MNVLVSVLAALGFAALIGIQDSDRATRQDEAGAAKALPSKEAERPPLRAEPAVPSRLPAPAPFSILFEAGPEPGGMVPLSAVSPVPSVPAFSVRPSFGAAAAPGCSAVPAFVAPAGQAAPAEPAMPW